MPEFIALCVKEAGKIAARPRSPKCAKRSISCRYYAVQARKLFGAPEKLPGPTGESNELQLHGRGVFVCISPWNFPLAIFMGQIAAALAAGNTRHRQAGRTDQPDRAIVAVKLLHEAGVPEDVLQFLPGDGATVGAALTRDPRVAGVVLHRLDRNRLGHQPRAGRARRRASATLIAETGGQNALIADSSALPEQLVKDAMVAAFDSAGQRCSAARVLFVQERHRRQGDRHAGRRDGRTRGRRSGAAVHRRRPGDRRGRAQASWSRMPSAWTRKPS